MEINRHVEYTFKLTQQEVDDLALVLYAAVNENRTSWNKECKDRFTDMLYAINGYEP